MSATYDRGLLFGSPATRLSVPFGERNEPCTAAGAAKRALLLVARLARFSLFVIPMTCAAGCFDAPPTYSEPTLVPPVIIADLCTPSTTQLVTLTPTPTSDPKFTVAFRADDGDLSLTARLIRDITPLTQLPPQALYTTPVTPDPRAFADQLNPSRSVDLKWPALYPDDRNYGCHTVTAIITDLHNFDGFVGTLKSEEAARITWFVWVQDPSGSTSPEPVTCFSPTPAGVPQ